MTGVSLFVRWLSTRRFGWWRLSSGWALDLGRLRVGYHSGDSTERAFPEADVREIERVHLAVADRLLATRGSVYEAFRNTGTGLNPDALEVWWQESPAAQSMGDQSGKAFGCALSVAMMAVEADRALRRKGRWYVFR